MMPRTRYEVERDMAQTLRIATKQGIGFFCAAMEHLSLTRGQAVSMIRAARSGKISRELYAAYQALEGDSRIALIAKARRAIEFIAKGGRTEEAIQQAKITRELFHQLLRESKRGEAPPDLCESYETAKKARKENGRGDRRPYGPRDLYCDLCNRHIHGLHDTLVEESPDGIKIRLCFCRTRDGRPGCRAIWVQMDREGGGLSEEEIRTLLGQSR